MPLLRKGKVRKKGEDPFIGSDPRKWPIIPREAVERVIKLIEEGDISLSDEQDKFAEEFRSFIGSKYALAEVNGTAALYSAYFTLGVGPGDEVIVPSYTYWATAVPAAVLGAKIVFAESDPRTFNIDPEDIRRKITEKTKVITVVHLWGLPCDMDAVCEICREHGIFLVEDASHAHGAVYKGKKVGRFGDISCFSFQASKLIPAGEGGILLTDNYDFYSKAVALGHYQKCKKLKNEYSKYDRTSLGFKFRMSPLHAAIGRVMLKYFGRYNSIITRNTERIREALASAGGFIDYRPPSYVKRVYYENIMDYDEKKSGIPRKKLALRLKMSRLGISPTRYPLLHQQPYFVERGSDPHSLPITEALVGRLFKIPTFYTDSPEAVEEWIGSFMKFYNSLKKQK